MAIKHVTTTAPLIPTRPTLDKLRDAAADCKACDLWKRGEIFTLLPGMRIMATVHPSSILRAPDDEARRREMDAFVTDLARLRKGQSRRGVTFEVALSRRRQGVGWKPTPHGQRTAEAAVATAGFADSLAGEPERTPTARSARSPWG